jgi:hypothetical protein
MSSHRPWRAALPLGGFVSNLDEAVAIKVLGVGLKAKSPPRVPAPEGLCLWPVHLRSTYGQCISRL